MLTIYFISYFHFQVGDYVDIVANATIHKGMPHKFYQGRTGIVYNVSKRAVGVEVNKVSIAAV
jgi:large subunit ribosomal protein L21e